MSARTRGRNAVLYPALRDVGAALLLVLLIFALHHNSLNYGLFMDDYAHYRQLQECDWSLAGLTDACRLELVGGVIDYWFMPDCTLRFFRPLAFGWMKLVYTLTGWSPQALHVSSLAWHLAACVLLMMLLRRLGATPLLTWGVAGLFALHPSLIATVQWIACQTELMVTTLLLAATLCYLQFRGWSSNPDAGEAPKAGYGWAAATVIFFIAALGCRENAIMFPFVMLAIELLLWKRRLRQVLVIYAVFGVVIVAYLAVRGFYLDGMAVPPRPYVMTPSDPGFFRFIFDKACYYLLGEFLLAPTIPFGGIDYLRQRPLMFYGLSAGVLLLLLAVSLRFFRRKPGLLAPAWLLGFMLPVLPSFASPHHLYLPGIGWAMTAMLVLRGIGGGTTSRTWLRPGIMWACLLLMGASFGSVTMSFGMALDTAQCVEDQVADEIALTHANLQDGDTIYIANLPIIAHYVGMAVEHRTGLKDLHVAALTWAPRVLGLASTADIPSEITWVDEHTIEMRLAEERYFSGPLGYLVSEASGQPVPHQTEESAARAGFRVEVLEKDEDGIRALRFTFDQPLSDPRIHLFWGSRVRWASELRPEGNP